MSALYNEVEPYAVQWLRNLVEGGHIAPGDVDGRSIREVQPDDVRGAVQCHFFAGIGIWSHALRAAGWPDGAPVWTGSCPCQPFSSAGKRGGTDDARHLWPEWFRLIRECRPPVILGEQVASPDGLGWLDAVFADLEGAGYACAAADTCAAGFGAAHIRQRLYFVAVRLADADAGGRGVLGRSGLPSHGDAPRGCDADGRGAAGGGVADSAGVGHDGRRTGEAGDGRDAARFQPQRLRDAGRLGHADSLRAGRDGGTGAGAPSATGWVVYPGGAGLEGLGGHGDDEHQPGRDGAHAPGPAAAAGDVEWLPCRDGKWRPTEPGLRPLAHGAASRVGRLRAYGNGLDARQATAFVRAVMGALS